MRKLLETLLFPPFLRRLDEKLLLERPSLWATRLHRVAWPAFLLLLLSLGLGLLTPVTRPYLINRFIQFGTIGIVLAQIGLIIYWLYGQDAYNTEREYGNSRDKTGWREFGTYLGALGMISLSLFLFLGTVRHRAQTHGSQLAHDLFLIHLADDIKERNGDIFEEVMGRPRISYHKEMSDAEKEERNNLNRAYAKTRYSRHQYETHLLIAAEQFTIDNKETLLGTYIFDGSMVSRSENGRTVRTRQQNSQWWDDEEFLMAHLDMDDFVQVRTEWEQGDYSSLFNVLSAYAGTPLQEIESDWDAWQTNSDSYKHNPLNHTIWDAHGRADDQLSFAFNPRINFALVFWAIVGALAVHLSLLRFTFKHSGLKGFIILVVSVVGMLFTAGLYMFLGEMIAYSDLFGYHYHSFWQKYVIVGLSLLLLLTTALFAYTHTIPRRSTFTWKIALTLYLLPILVAIVPYTVFGIEELVTDIINDRSWFSVHFINNPANMGYINSSPVGTWSVAPLGQYMLYFAQFAYIPMLGWLKRKHTRLMSLPRS